MPSKLTVLTWLWPHNLPLPVKVDGSAFNGTKLQSSGMNTSPRKRGTTVRIACLLVWLALPSFSQKVKTGYDKAVDFAQYKTYQWADLNQARGRPIVAELVIGNVKHELENKGLQEVEANPDLLLFPAGGFDSTFAMSAGYPVGNYLTVPITIAQATWVGPVTVTTEGMSPIVHAGTLNLAFIEPKSGRLVWEGSVSDKFDLEDKKESINRVEKCVAKLLKDFPPRKK
jgi:hypothetical protein